MSGESLQGKLEQPDLSVPTAEQQAKIEAVYEAQKDTESPYKGVWISTLGDLRWIMQQRHWSGEIDTSPQGMQRVNLSGAHFIDANLSGVSLCRANLSDTDLTQSNLSGADLSNANLSMASLSRANLSGANLHHANLHQFNPLSNLDEVNLSGADLQGADLSGADLSGANLSGANLSGANLSEATFGVIAGEPDRAADLSRADLSGANLSRASFWRANLSEAILKEVDLNGANLCHADLSGARLSATNLSGANLRFAIFDTKTNLTDIQLSGGNIRLADIIWGNAALVRVDWEPLQTTGDETEARKTHFNKDANLHKKDEIKTREVRRDEWKAAVRSYRLLAVALREQGLNEEADRYAYRAQHCQGQVTRYEHRWGRMFGNSLLDLTSGYGYRPRRTIVSNFLIVSAFSLAYLTILAPASGLHLSPWAALVTSVASFHGRGFFPAPNVALDSPIAVAGAGEAIIGLIIEASFIATFTQRFFAR